MKNYQTLAVISMVFAGLTSVIAKAGLKNVSGDTALAVRTIFVFGFVWINVLVFKDLTEFSKFTTKDVVLLGISGLTTALSWIFYYRAIKIGDVSQVALIDKGSILITIVLATIFLGETLTWKTAFGGGLVLVGISVLTFLK